MPKTESKPIDKMTSAEAAEALAVVEKRLGEVRERVRAIRPPAKAQPAPPDAGRTGWTPPDPLASAGPEYRQCIDDGDPETLASLTREHEQLQAELTMLALRRDKLRTRQKTAAHEEKLDAAPKVAKEGLSALDGALDDADAALKAAAEALDRVAELRRSIDRARELLDNESHFYSPETLRRCWAIDAAKITGHRLRLSLSTRPDEIEGVIVPSINGPRVVNTKHRRDAETKLRPPLLKDFRRPVRAANPQMQGIEERRAEERARQEWAENRACELASAIE